MTSYDSCKRNKFAGAPANNHLRVDNNKLSFFWQFIIILVCIFVVSNVMKQTGMKPTKVQMKPIKYCKK